VSDKYGGIRCPTRPDTPAGLVRRTRRVPAGPKFRKVDVQREGGLEATTWPRATFRERRPGLVLELGDLLR